MNFVLNINIYIYILYIIEQGYTIISLKLHHYNTSKLRMYIFLTYF